MRELAAAYNVTILTTAAVVAAAAYTNHRGVWWVTESPRLMHGHLFGLGAGRRVLMMRVPFDRVLCCRVPFGWRWPL